MKPLCKKIYLFKLLELPFLLLTIFLDVMLIINVSDDTMCLIVIIFLTVFIALWTIDVVYWAFQPKVLIYQYETGIVIKRNIKIEYTSIKSVNYENYVRRSGRRNAFYRDTSSGIVLIKLKSGKTYKIRNAYYPLETADALSRIKQQRRFK